MIYKVSINRCIFTAKCLLITCLVLAFFSPAQGEQEAVSSDDASAMMAHLQAAAEGGDPWAQLNLGAAYDHGLAGLQPNPALAVKWYLSAAQQGVAEAQFNLAHLMVTRPQPGQSDEDARYWMQQAAQQGMPEAEYLFGVMLLEGIGSNADRQQAEVWLRRSADNGYALAAEALDKGNFK